MGNTKPGDELGHDADISAVAAADDAGPLGFEDPVLALSASGNNEKDARR